MKEDTLAKALQAIREYYQAQGMAKELGFGQKPALLIVDFQRGITDPRRPAGCDLEEPIENTLKVLNKAREKKIPIYFFTLSYHPTLFDGGLLLEKVPLLSNFKEGTDNVHLDPRLKPREGEPVIAKKYASCFHGTSLATLLTLQQVDTLIITGCITSGCIRATANDGLQQGFRPIIPRECVGDRAQIPHEVNLMDIHARCGDVVPLEKVTGYLDSL
ncbi:MAG: isochorismatase family protein [Candidatus Syntrophonatronum acetioxidans]|uniref:Isochorismatase family protein n=1 Tax=Candidatus Syntrophonatronum acetioxidans TaxID=1795816 RepID=A0A424YCV6_9FIRM|nr:MAG: isochorismatase family protein [Candidatus Syntrophonatronum acetioxidans]